MSDLTVRWCSDATTTEVAYVDNALRGDVVEKPEDVASIRRLWQRLSSKALPEDESIDMIKEVAAAWVS